MTQRTQPKQRVAQTPTAAHQACQGFALLGLFLFFVLRVEATAVIGCILLALLLASGLVARLSLAGLSITIEPPRQRVHAGECLPIRVTLHNRNRFLPVFSPCLDLRDSSHSHVQPFHFPACIGPGKRVTVMPSPKLSTRGEQRILVTGWRSLFPFSLLETQVHDRIESDAFIVWPARVTCNVDSLLRRSDESAERLEQTRRKQIEPHQLSSIREYRLGDTQRSINWRLSAKLDKLMVIESHPRRRKRIDLELTTDSRRWMPAPRFERMLELVAALVIELQRRDALRFFILNGQRIAIRQRRSLDTLLDELSLSVPIKAPAATEDSLGNELYSIVPCFQNGIALERVQIPRPSVSNR